MRRGKCESEYDGGQECKGVKPLEVFNRFYMASDGNFVNIWDANGFFPFQGSLYFCHEFTLILKSK